MENELDKQTAVDFLIDKLINLGYLYTAQYGQTPLVNKAIKQAKEMENAQKAYSFHLGMETQRLIDKGKNGE
jgi:hypothetical protein